MTYLKPTRGYVPNQDITEETNIKTVLSALIDSFEDFMTYQKR